jgi:hypothetical protein
MSPPSRARTRHTTTILGNSRSSSGRSFVRSAGCGPDALLPRRAALSARTTNRSATRPNPSHPMLRHDVDSCELAIGRSFEHRRSRNEAEAAARSNQRRCRGSREGSSDSATARRELPCRSRSSMTCQRRRFHAVKRNTGGSLHIEGVPQGMSGDPGTAIIKWSSQRAPLREHRGVDGSAGLLGAGPPLPARGHP